MDAWVWVCGVRGCGCVGWVGVGVYMFVCACASVHAYVCACACMNNHIYSTLFETQERESEAAKK